MSNENITCPICGSDKIQKFEVKNSDQLTLGDQFTFHEIYYKCQSCNEETDISGQTSKNYLMAQKIAEAALVKELIKQLMHAGVSMAFFERAFELPIRTLTRWKTGDFSSTALALLRVVKTYPWIAEVAEHRFDPDFASKAMSVEYPIEVGGIFDSEITTEGSFATTTFYTTSTQVHNGTI